MKTKTPIKRQWLNLRPLLGFFNWAMCLVLLGARELGKSYSILCYFIDSFIFKGIPFTWLRLTQSQVDDLLKNKAEKLVDPDLRRKYGLDLITIGNNVYHVTKRSPDGHIKERVLMCRVFALSNFYNEKGQGLFDKDFLKDLSMQYHICLDEFEKEQGERSQGDILYQFVNQIENLIRSTKERVKIFIVGNMLDSCADILAGLNFIPEEFGTYKLKSKRTVVVYSEPSDAYLERRKGTFADLWYKTASTFTNKIEIDKTIVDKSRLVRPVNIIKFSKDKSNWFTLFESGIINKYNGEHVEVIAMKPYLDEQYILERRNKVFECFNMRAYKFHTLIAFKEFQKQMELMKPKG